MFGHMIRSFTADEPPFDLVCTDEVMLRRFAAEGRVLPLNRLMERDGVGLDGVTPATREAVTLGGEVLGLPCVNVANMLLYRRGPPPRPRRPVPHERARHRPGAGGPPGAGRR